MKISTILFSAHLLCALPLLAMEISDRMEVDTADIENLGTSMQSLTLGGEAHKDAMQLAGEQNSMAPQAQAFGVNVQQNIKTTVEAEKQLSPKAARTLLQNLVTNMRFFYQTIENQNIAVADLTSLRHSLTENYLVIAEASDENIHLQSMAHKLKKERIEERIHRCVSLIDFLLSFEALKAYTSRPDLSHEQRAWLVSQCTLVKADFNRLVLPVNELSNVWKWQAYNTVAAIYTQLTQA